MHSRSKHWHLIDYAIVWRKDRHHAKVAKTMCGADNQTDYRLVVSILDVIIHPARQPQGQKAPKRSDVSKLKDNNKRQMSSMIFAQIRRIAPHVRGSRRELDSISFHFSAVDSLGQTISQTSNKTQKWDPLRAMKTFIRRKVGHTT